MLIAIVMILALPRRRVITPFLLAFFTVPLTQVVLVGTLHFPMVRVLILVGLFRCITSGGMFFGRKFAGGFNGVDRAVIFWTISSLAIVSLQWMNLQAFVKFAGDFVDTLGGYLVVRFFVPDREAIGRTVRVLAMICVIHGACMINEHVTRTNVVGYLGGMGLNAEVRDGRVRSGGLLGTIQSGSFGGVLVPLFVWLWADRQSRITAAMGTIGATAMVITSGSSTSVMALGAGVVGLGFWALRKQMRMCRWGLVLMLTVLHLVMTGPVWWLIARIDVTGGSSSYHRYQLIDTLIRHCADWWLLGTRENGTWGWEMWDTCNQFVDVAVKGGLLTLAFYILILKRSFAAIGNARKRMTGDRNRERCLWCLGATLFANVVAQFGINYLIQLQLLLFPVLACISVATIEVRESPLRTEHMLNETTWQLKFSSGLPALRG